ncbi:Ca2+-transporting ATPase [Carnobacterium iners]|uniref:P-type Ca(2+) transporter n=1 Tax=Carnobacterium iners TaxID=1073423 RepID=A0A1X7N6N6_9LACT|nr:cation-translocating P-type ATPase [Carnobacterium iners]SEK60955.1 Ca2+-transporting ATPase [Carnobacterium iners]SMH32236.1 Ca2+-transporting ATPase [Carnobacterium iners]
MDKNNQKNKTFFTLEKEAVFDQAQSSEKGLTSAQAEKRMAEYGPNQLNEGKTKSLLVKFFEQFKDFMIIVLLAAAVISGIFGDITDSIIILVVVVLNAVLGVFQEAKAEEAINALKEMSSPEARVKRDGTIVSLKSDQLVVGDVVLLEAGNIVPADLRLIEVASLQIEESGLTGESVPVNKELTVLEDEKAGIGDRTNMAYMNSNVTYGRGEGVVVGTGMNTEVGGIAKILASTDETVTPLQNNLNRLGKYLTVAILVIAIIIFIVGLLNGRGWLDMLLTSISLAVAAIPEGLPAIVTIILALGTQKMAKRKALVRRLPAVETLGSTDIICSDKTGTLTMNQMTVEKIYANGQLQDSTDSLEIDSPILYSMMYANDTQISGDGTLIGDPTETALIQFALDKEINVSEVLAKEPRVAEIPFDSERKLMSTVQKQADGKFLVSVKGAPDELLKRCTRYIQNDKVERLDEASKKIILETNHELAIQALRVLATAYKQVESIPTDMSSENVEQELVFSGLIGMIDPEREEAKGAVSVARRAGIRSIMITGDHRDTAEAIAKRLGILEATQVGGVITGAELDQISDEEFSTRVKDYSVYARVSPQHKVRIVKAWQKAGKIVAMTGDGVNDAPALKTADIGIGMGITGTEVSKGASDMVLADDNFSTIVVAVEEGRKVFSNIQKSIQFLLSANLGEVLTLFIATLLGWSILAPVHILWINLVTDTFPAIALGLEPAEADSMEQKPRGKEATFFSNGVLGSIIYQGVIEGGITLFVYWWATYYPIHAGNAELIHNDALTMAFITLGMLQLFHAFNVKSVKKSLFTVGFFKNKMFNLSILVSGALLAVVVLIPGLNDAFRVSHLDTIQWVIVLSASFSIIPIVELIKLGIRTFDKRG